jgi:excinuclease ABC subunit A
MSEKTSLSSSHDAIRIRGAREHNLKNIDLDIPRNQLIVITGVSGSGKSTIAFETLYAEAQRRYWDSLSTYARQFMEQQKKPDVDEITGLSPAIAIEQKTISRNPRSTVGTITEIHDFLRLLFARVGVPYSPATGKPIENQTISQMADLVRRLPLGTKLYLLSPLVQGAKGEYRKELLNLKKQGFQRVMIDGEIYELETIPVIEKNKKHDIDVVIDRITIQEDLGHRLVSSIETAAAISNGLLIVEIVEPGAGTEEEYPKGKRILYSQHYSCPISGFQLTNIEPRMFSFNSPHGACVVCDGLGTELFFDEQLILQPKASLPEGAIVVWEEETQSKYYVQLMQALARHYGFNLETSYEKLPPLVQKAILYGTGDVALEIRYHDGMRQKLVNKPFEGVVPQLERRLADGDSGWTKEDFAKYQTERPCSACQGFRLRPESLCVKIAEKHVGEVSRLTISDALNWVQSLSPLLSNSEQQIAERILKELTNRLGFLQNVGLDYLTLARGASTLSGGESQRIRLASQIGSGLTGVLYVLDEPSIGLHQSDNHRLIQTLRHLQSLNNTVVVVEHDEETMLASDWLIDVGPGAGVHGGNIIAQGTPEQVAADLNSVTGHYLSGRKMIAVPKVRRTGHEGKKIILNGAKGNNLQDITVEFPLGCFISVTGVSGGGKSTLIINTLYKAAMRMIEGSKLQPAPYVSLTGLEYVDKIIEIDQSPIGRTPRSNPATYTGAFSPIRDWYVELPESKARGYKAGRFSFNVKGGRCEACQGDGMVKIEMHFLPDVYVECEMCNGLRYNKETLEIKYKNKSIADVLAMTVEESLGFFEKVPAIHEKLDALNKVGLGYISIGQSATTLSGGEAQRVKLAKELSKRSTGKTLYILDEPTTGLHMDDVAKLLNVLHALVEMGNTVLVIEHNLDVIKTSDWVIDIGPGGGDKGGELVAACTPEELSNYPRSVTGRFLAEHLKRLVKEVA